MRSLTHLKQALILVLVLMCSYAWAGRTRLPTQNGTFRPALALRTIAISSIMSVGLSSTFTAAPVFAKTELPELSKCFNAIEKELDPKNDASALRRLQEDVRDSKWDDIRTFSREYDAGFRGGVLKSIWKQLGDKEAQQKGIALSNSFTFDLIALNKAARSENLDDAKVRIVQVEQDLKDFMKLNPVN